MPVQSIPYNLYYYYYYTVTVHSPNDNNDDQLPSQNPLWVYFNTNIFNEKILQSFQICSSLFQVIVKDSLMSKILSLRIEPMFKFRQKQVF